LLEAKRKEELAYDFYSKLINYVKDLGTKAMIKELAEEERRHKDILDDILKKKDIYKIQLGDKCYIYDLGISIYLKPEVVTKDLTVDAVLRIAIKSEENSRKFYSVMAEKFKGTEAEDIFKQLAHEEMCHRNNFQLLYDDIVLNEN
ncbi:MAG: ferritin family protein, partial [Deferribacterota bacterium]|nr:ferritin family protein [Deferribacterota bacterium]